MLLRGGLRLLTLGEIRLAIELFGHSIQYARVWIHHGSYLPFGMQGNNTAMTPNGEIWFETNIYRDDYSFSSIDYQHLFMHEMMHVWQYQHGMNVRVRGLFYWAENYHYDLKNTHLSTCSMEQQASIVADYWLLMKYGFEKNSRLVNYYYYNSTRTKKELLEHY